VAANAPGLVTDAGAVNIPAELGRWLVALELLNERDEALREAYAEGVVLRVIAEALGRQPRAGAAGSQEGGVMDGDMRYDLVEKRHRRPRGHPRWDGAVPWPISCHVGKAASRCKWISGVSGRR
jgi:hypothetical protein